MTSWITSWLPPLPSIDLSSALPSAIQSRFISFLLKRTLGHFVKPGQFDVAQVDSQIGSGFVQVRDLRLDEDAINGLLQGFPLRLKEGGIASVVARVPWPNPLTSIVGMSIQSLRLTLAVVPGTNMKASTAHLADSVASVAETFIHEELTSREEAMLRESIYSETLGATFSTDELKNVPGGFDVDADPFHSPDSEAHEAHFNPEGVGIFATLIEGLLARFKLDVHDVRITIVDENNASFTLSVPEIQYGTECPDSSPAEPGSQAEGASRVLTISGVTLSSRCFRPPRILPSSYAASPTSTLSPVSPAQDPLTASVHSDALTSIILHDPAPASVAGQPDRRRMPSPISSSASDSSMDEETQMMMSQSLVSLPPRPSDLTYSHQQEAIEEEPSASAPTSQSVASLSLSDIYSAYQAPEEEYEHYTEDPPSDSPFLEHLQSDSGSENAYEYDLSRPPRPLFPEPSIQDERNEDVDVEALLPETPISRSPPPLTPFESPQAPADFSSSPQSISDGYFESGPSMYHGPEPRSTSSTHSLAASTYHDSETPSVRMSESVASSMYESAVSHGLAISHGHGLDISRGLAMPGGMWQSTVSDVVEKSTEAVDPFLFEARQGVSSSPAAYERATSPVESVKAQRSPVEREPTPVEEHPASPPPPPITSSGPAAQQARDEEGDIILSFGSEPIVIRLTTPPVRGLSSKESSSSTQPIERNKQHSQTQAVQQEKSKLTVTIGVMAVALSARHVQSALSLLSQLPSSLSSKPSSVKTQESGILDQLSVEVTVRGVVLLLLLSPSAIAEVEASTRVTQFFSHPLVPPKGIGNYLRVHLEALSLQVSSLSQKPAGKGKISPRSKPPPASSTTTAKFTLHELSAFAYLSDSKDSDCDYHAIPILITDPNLPSHYTSQHTFPVAGYSFQDDTSAPELPTFDIADWTDVRHRAVSAKITTWRTKAAPQQGRRSSYRLSSSPGTRSLASSPPKRGNTVSDVQPHAAVRVNTTLTADGLDVRMDIVPLHVFLDLELLSPRSGKAGEDGLLSFLAEATDFEANVPVAHDAEDSDEESQEDTDGETTPPATPRIVTDVKETDRERERRRLEALVLQDLDLSFDYRVKDVVNTARKIDPPNTRNAAKRQDDRKVSSKLNVVLALPVLRVQVRCPPPPGCAPRSGSAILDIHDIEISSGPQSSRGMPARARFAEFVDVPRDIPSSQDDTSSNEVLRARWARILVSYVSVGHSKAVGILSLGSLSPAIEPSSSSPGERSRQTPALLPRLRLLQSSLHSQSDASVSVSTTVVAVDLPSAYVALSKPILDGLQLWADDIAQLSERAAKAWRVDEDSSKATSLIGSRYFMRQGSSGAASQVSNTLSPSLSAHRSETVMKLNLTEAFVRILLPRAAKASRPLDLSASDLDLLVEIKPEGKDETVMTLAIANIGIREVDPTTTIRTMLSKTHLRQLGTSGRPMLKLRFTSAVVSDRGTAKQSRIRLSLSSFTYNLLPDLAWATDLSEYVKAPPGAFESVVPSERTRVSIKVLDGSVRLWAPTHPGALVMYMGETEFDTDIIGGSPHMAFRLAVPSLSLFMIDDKVSVADISYVPGPEQSYWKSTGYALFCEIINFHLKFSQMRRDELPETEAIIQGLDLRVHLCADTASALTAFLGDFGTLFSSPAPEGPPSPALKRRPTDVSENPQGLAYSMDEYAFRRVPEVGAAPDMISDDLPTNPDYLDASFGAAAGFRELTDSDLDEFDEQDIPAMAVPSYVSGIVSNVGGETVRMLDPEGIHIDEGYFETLTPEKLDQSPEVDETILRVRADDCNVSLFLYDGYDWARTRRIIEEEMKAMKRRLAKIRQLVASGQTYDPSVEETSALLFNSVYIGLEQDLGDMESDAIIAAIDEELKEDVETGTQSSWQSLRPQGTGTPNPKPARLKGRRLARSKGPNIEIRLMSMHVTVDQWGPDKGLTSRIFATVKELEILDHIKTSTWRKFLSELITDSRGNMRETDSNMVRIELCQVCPVPGNPSEEARLKARAKILPLRLNVDQDALDFFKKFFSFQDPDAVKEPSANPDEGMYFQYAEIFPVDIKLDYKPRRVDYRALREGKTIELMNFFHFDGAEMTLRHLTLYGITGWPRLFDMLNDLWTPDVKATQMVDIISGLSPIRSVVNVGSGVADLVLLPIAQYKKDGRVIRGMQKGTSAFVKSTAMEAIKLGAQLATGTQVILEQAETVLGAQFGEQLTAEALQIPTDDEFGEMGEVLGDEDQDLISRYAEQPSDIKEGIQSAYKSLRRNFSSAAQTILAVPMEVYERSGNEGPVRAVIRAVPIAVLKPMIGASEAVSKTLLGLQNTLDPSVRQEAEAKYKHR
ncbi:hypothetical protein NEOLEDRAFT_1177476 [Neolentinus lepideus HHB14362 ss-1]|uniref:Autophagy-related protein 2 n=1 Tax=Neolentinus lepideus HHB14362 ss-1 TaxID=1314782 RepID=A0A165TCP2_9AGAM|nr:hypothetical protein NEOLEDRAFT_1177476 [Neolentinus lepideus HHB14362 ss-1]